MVMVHIDGTILGNSSRASRTATSFDGETDGCGSIAMVVRLTRACRLSFVSSETITGRYGPLQTVQIDTNWHWTVGGLLADRHDSFKPLLILTDRYKPLQTILSTAMNGYTAELRWERKPLHHLDDIFVVAFQHTNNLYSYYVLTGSYESYWSEYSSFSRLSFV